MGISLEQAQATRFQNSTTPELHEYCEQLGLTHGTQDERTTLITRLMAACGLGQHTFTQQGDTPKVARASGEDVVPPYNLTPDGIWGGRRHRVKLPVPEGSKLAKSERFDWNGKFYSINYEEPTDIPEPILEILRNNKGRRISQEKIGTDGESTTRITPTDRGFSYIGVTPGTEHLAGSMTEWYQKRGAGWYDKRSPQEINLIAGKLGVKTRHELNGRTEVVPHADVVAGIKTFLFGYPDAIDAPEKKQKEVAA